VAGIMGAGRSWTVWMISVLSIPQVGGRDAEVGVAQLSLDHDEGDALPGHLNSMRVPELVGREPAPYSGDLGSPAQLHPHAGGCAWAAACRASQYAEQRADGEARADREPRK
jgi:hypothetical protein